eukprot:1617400-Rhodomonas_salina.1
MLSKVLEEFVKRGVHLSHDCEFFKTFVPILHKQRVELEAEEDEANEEEENEEDDADKDGEEDEDEGEDGDDDDDEDELDAVMQELAKCYYLLFGVKVRKYKTTYDDVDNLLVREEDAAAGATPSSSRGKPKVERVPPSPDFCVGLWEFVKVFCDKASGGRERQTQVQNVKEVLEAMRA